MKKPLIIGALALAALTAMPAAASAQSRSYYGDRDRDGRYERWEQRADQNRYDGGRYSDRERDNDRRRGQRDQYRDYRSGPPYGNAYGHRRWARGQAIPSEYRRQWYINDYRRYGYRAPPRGYGYYRTDTGDIVIAAIATGVILSLLNN